MKKVTLNYDEATGQLIDALGINVGVYMGIKSVETDALEVSSVIKLKDAGVSSVIKLKDAGFDADEIVKMYKEGLL